MLFVLIQSEKKIKSNNNFVFLDSSNEKLAKIIAKMIAIGTNLIFLFTKINIKFNYKSKFHIKSIRLSS